MSDPRSSLQRLGDWWAVTTHGGLRVRVLGPHLNPRVIVTGRLPGPTPEAIRREVFELISEATGTFDVVRRSEGGYRVTSAGPLAGPRLEQRLRNVLGNL